MPLKVFSEIQLQVAHCDDCRVFIHSSSSFFIFYLFFLEKIETVALVFCLLDVFQLSCQCSR